MSTVERDASLKRFLPWAGAAAGIGLGIAVGWRLLSQREALPCPSWLSILLDNPYMNWIAGAETLLDRAEVTPGMSVLDVGCGPGRLTAPLARRVGPAGSVVALDIQPEMLRRAQKRVADAGMGNTTFVLGGAGTGLLGQAVFDRAFLVTVLGEIPDRPAALVEIYRALKPGGVLSVTEVLPDPHYQLQPTVRRLAAEAGFLVGPYWPQGIAFTAHFVRPPLTDHMTQA
jgi:ubiquinone/menaquinone biosynthesis C-methylase UbiE